MKKWTAEARGHKIPAFHAITEGQARIIGWKLLREQFDLDIDKLEVTVKEVFYNANSRR